MTGHAFQEESRGYTAAVLKAYLQLPETPSKANFNDRQTAAALHAVETLVDRGSFSPALPSIIRSQVLYDKLQPRVSLPRIGIGNVS